MRRVFPILTLLLVAACGPGILPPRSNSSQLARQALASSAEALEIETPAARQEFFREVARTSMLEAGRSTPEGVLFPLVDGDRRLAAPGFDPSTDLLVAADAGQTLQLTFGGQGGERWPEDRRDSLQGLSEREAVELVARSLLGLWNLRAVGLIQVDRAAGAPYAVAYVDGILRVNPSFLYLAAAPSSLPLANQ